MTTVYVLTFDASWREGLTIQHGAIDYPVTAPNGAFDMTGAILACQIVSAEAGRILYPEHGVGIQTHTWDIEIDPIWDDGAVRVY